MPDETQTNTPPQNQPTNHPFRTAGLFLWDLIKILVIALVIIIPFRMFIAEPFVVSGSSMQPNFHDRDYLIVDRLSYRTSPPQRGDVIVLKYPKDESEFFIKRIIGLPGDTIEFQNNRVVIVNQQYPNGLVLNEPYIPAGVPTLPLGPSTIGPLPQGEYFVLGDNRTGSSDSRFWGLLPADDIVGRVWMRVFPVSQFGLIPRQSYQ